MAETKARYDLFRIEGNRITDARHNFDDVTKAQVAMGMHALVTDGWGVWSEPDQFTIEARFYSTRKDGKLGTKLLKMVTWQVVPATDFEGPDTD